MGRPLTILTLVINLLLTFLIIFWERKKPSSTYAWLLFLWIFPIVGFVFYILFSQKFSSRKVYRYRMKQMEVHEDKLAEAQAKMIRDGIPKDSPLYRFREYADNIEYQNNVCDAVFTADNDVKVITDGTVFFDVLMKNIEEAKETINIEFYIFKSDKIGKDMINLLIKKALEGVQVRILYDEIGSRLLSFRSIYRMKQAGIAISPFLPSKLTLFSRYFQLRINYRDHRKVVVIDGKTGYIGGFNIGDEYVGRSNRFGYWRDTNLKIEGPAVSQMQLRFLTDWATNKADIPGMPVSEYQDILLPKLHSEGDVGVQIVASGPDTVNQNIKQGYLKMINDAKKHIYITSPYFVLDDTMLEALKIALLSGVKVYIMIPSKPDHPFILPTTLSYAGELLTYGAKVYQYQNGFVHSKVMCVDDALSVVGSCNFDIRSFALNFECSAFLYSKEINHKLIEDFQKDVLLSKEYTLDEYKHKSIMQAFRESVSRLLSPLL